MPNDGSAALLRETSFINSAIAGGAAACAATVVFHPLDTAKTVMQQSGGGVARVRALGPAGLYRGIIPAAFSMMPACAVRMSAYEVLKRSFLQQAPSALPPGALVFAASALSVVASAIVRAPLDLVKTRVQADGSISASRAMLEAVNGGLGGLYRGAGLGLMRDVPFFGFNLLIYEQLKATVVQRKARGTDAPAPPTQLEFVAIGALAQGIAGLITNPVDVLKTRVQSGAAASASAALAACVHDGGVRSLMRGAGLRVAWIAPQGCIYYPAYEAAQRLLGDA